MCVMSFHDLIQGEGDVQNCTASYWVSFVCPIESHDQYLLCLTLIGPNRSYDLINLPWSFQLKCPHQAVLFFESKKQEYSLIKVFNIYSEGSECPIFHKIGNARGSKTSKLGVLGEYHSWQTAPETG